MCPICPLRGEVLKEEFSQCLTIITDDSLVRICTKAILLIQNVGEGLKVISTSLLELLIEFRSPVCTIHLIGIIEESVWEWHILPCKSIIKMSKIARNCISVKMIYHETFSTRSSSFHLLTCSAKCGILLFIKHNSACSIFLADPRTTERPSCSCGHTCLYPQLPSTSLHIHGTFRLCGTCMQVRDYLIEHE